MPLPRGLVTQAMISRGEEGKSIEELECICFLAIDLVPVPPVVFLTILKK
jgi:hypothetical protein